ncbi:MAG: hypothetical protein J6S67_14935 [Methanobrevibacter sp.]|nr:hypothetical protein [Methanobrevibacter sp.]
MKLIIDINEEVYSDTIHDSEYDTLQLGITLKEIIKKGTPLEEELEKVIEYAEKSMILRDNVYDNTTEYSVSMRDLINIIRKRISELKGENK